MRQPTLSLFAHFAAIHGKRKTLLTLMLLLLSTVSAFGQSVVANVRVGGIPMAVAVNPVTNRIYTANFASNDVTVIDGATNSITTVKDPNARAPSAVAVNPMANKVYVANLLSNNVTVINGADNSVTTVTDSNAIRPFAVGVNPVTNKIYVANQGNATTNLGNVTVIDGATSSIVTVTDPNASSPSAVAVNSVTDKIYVTNSRSPNATVIDGATNSTTTIASVPGAALDLNPLTDKVYVCETFIGGAVIVIDGATNSTTTVTDPNAVQPEAVAVNSITDKIYVANFPSSNITVIDGATNSTTTIPNVNSPTNVAVNSITNKIYIKNLDFKVTVIDGVTNSAVTLNTPSSNTMFISPNLIAVNSVTNRAYVLNPGSDNVSVIASLIPFSSFNGKLALNLAKGSFHLNANFVLGPGGTINPVTQAVTLSIGRYSVTIPAGSFVKRKRGYVFRGIINGVLLHLLVQRRTTAGSYRLLAGGRGANLSGTTNPVAVTLSIGDNIGMAHIEATIAGE
jgi:YVTN family beta-propeller protein